MRQSGKELGVIRGAGRLLNQERREALALSPLEDGLQRGNEDARAYPIGGAGFRADAVEYRRPFF
ncbi:hypothetical protein [Paenibacillus abyssi]|uniref:Uncharacterized protein n=1 Tax=Paenibacillus abyssi TaxID=1340531 RepID=A0A917LG16_9BACL|nr:hypothetical protein [Paenibacillus abyssi]GGG19934.1 hypothetical protein GCM10010916_40910 [Paenibacillus abyssi]